MKLILSRPIVSLLLISSLAQAEEHPGFPKVYFEYGIFDGVCRSTANHPITPEMTQEISSVLPTLQAKWDEEGPKLLGATVTLVGRGFVRKELIATLILCDGIPPMSSPFLINMRPYLKTAGGSFSERLPYLISSIFHEILHRYLVENFSETVVQSSELLKKYGRDCGIQNCGTVLTHMHLMAILETVYLQLGREEELKQIIEVDSAIVDPGYKRAWEIVNAEGPEAFMRELRSAAKAE